MKEHRLFSSSVRFTDDSRKVRVAHSQDDSRRMIRATGNDSRNSMDVSRKQAAILCFVSN